MEELNQLATIVRQKGQRSIQLANQNFRKKEKSKDNLLYELILNEKIDCDEKAARILFNSNPANRNFRNTKLKLRQKLMNHLFFLDYDRSTNTQFDKIQYDCLLKLSQFKILIMEGQSLMVLKRIPWLIKTAMEYELIEIVLESLIILRNEYSKLGKYNPQMEAEQQLQELRPFHKTIIDSEAVYYDTLVLINKSKNSCHKIRETIPERIKLIKDNAIHFKSNRLEILSKLLSIHYYFICNQSDLILDLCNELEEKYIPADISKITVNLDPAFIAGIKLEALFKLNDQNKFNKYCSRKIELFKQGSEKWFLFMEYWLLLLLKSENYNEAVTLYKKIKNNTGFNKIGPDIKERWLIYRSYLCFISNCKEIQWGFNIDKFARLKPDSNKQNIAYNIAFLIIRFLFSLREGNINEVKEYVEKLQNYSSFHLDKRHNYRNSIFIRMLSLVITNNFEYDLINERVSVYYQKLVENKVIQYISDEMEVIPYEKLWSIIKNILKTNKHFIHFRFYHFTEA